MRVIETNDLNILRDRIYNANIPRFKRCSLSWQYNLYIAQLLIKVWNSGNEILYADRSRFGFSSRIDQIDNNEEWFIVQFSNYIKNRREDLLACMAICFFHWAGRKQLDLNGINRSFHKDYFAAKEFIKKLSFNEDINFTFSVFFNRKASSLQEKIESSLICLFILTEKYNIDLLWYIEKRLEYTEKKNKFKKYNW